MDFRSLTLGAKIRVAVFLILAVYLVYGGVASVVEFRELQLGQLTKNAANSDIYIDGANFSLFFLAGAGLVDTFLIMVTSISYTLIMLLLGVVISSLLRIIGLRKKLEIDKIEYKICFKVYYSLVFIGLIISLIITKGGLLLAIVMFELPSAVVMWLIYLSQLKKRSLPAKEETSDR